MVAEQETEGGWGLKGFVISDAGAVGGANVFHNTASGYPEATAQAIASGLDVIFQTAYAHNKLFSPPFLNGAIDPKVIDDAVLQVLRAKFELGLFEQPYVSQADIESLATIKHKPIAKEAALRSIVLLKNEHKALPLSKSGGTIALLGQDALEARLGGYSGPGNHPVSIREGLKAAYLGELIYRRGTSRVDTPWTVVPKKFLSHIENAK